MSPVQNVTPSADQWGPMLSIKIENALPHDSLGYNLIWMHRLKSAPTCVKCYLLQFAFADSYLRKLIRSQRLRFSLRIRSE